MCGLNYYNNSYKNLKYFKFNQRASLENIF